MSDPVPALLDPSEARLTELIPELVPAPALRGRPEILPGALLWSGLLVCILRGATSQQALWRLLSQAGLWSFPRVPVSAEAVRLRLVRTGATIMPDLFRHVSAVLAQIAVAETTVAPFATGVYALDESTLDHVARTLPTVRAIPAGDDRLLPGKRSTAFALRTQQFATVLTTALPRQNEKVVARDLVRTLPVGSLLLADLGYFAFPWFDELIDAGYHLISRRREQTTYETAWVLPDVTGMRDELVWLGTYRADRAKHLQRLITVPVGQTTRRYLTSVLDPAVLPAADVVQLYGRRWNIEEAFKLVKRELGWHLLWSAAWELILTQVVGVLLIAQIATALRSLVAARAGVDVFTVSPVLLLRDLPALVQRAEGDLIGMLARLPVVKGGYLRPSRRVRYVIPPDLPIQPRPSDLVLTRTPRYGGRHCLEHTPLTPLSPPVRR